MDDLMCLLSGPFHVSHNQIPHPTTLTIEQRKDITPAILGNSEPHKFIHLHFKYAGHAKSKHIIMHQYIDYATHNWYRQADIDKLNMFRIAACAMHFGVDIYKGERRYRYLTKAERAEWFPGLQEFAGEVRENAVQAEEELEKEAQEEAQEEAEEEAEDEDEPDEANEANEANEESYETDSQNEGNENYGVGYTATERRDSDTQALTQSLQMLRTTADPVSQEGWA
ncbi:hypothetical protein SBOR_1770 [Sclerotinia borealis F-4128]|uniref:Uncharacterized protein n=1 Tax=Sclerotinia borealis (strain F-4128) TaxID=1432307 RepID=W9CTK1_SCLBF|nr:hypothetical protein SBOR_1770 [Sclerotinia borealis F-4128]